MGVILKNGVYYSGPAGRGIFSIVQNADYTLTIRLTDGTTYTTAPATGAGIESITFNDNSTITIEIDNGDVFTSPPLNYLPPVVSDDIGKTLVVNENAMWDTENVSFECWTKYSTEEGEEPEEPSDQKGIIVDRLPHVTADDVGKFMRVDAQGVWRAVSMLVGDLAEF